MGGRERRTRERQQVRDGILAAARTIATDEGWGAVTIRKIADAIDYSSPIIYEHFANKDAVLLELLREGFRDLRARLEAARAAGGDPPTVLRRIARAYWAFAQEAPELYQVMYGLGGVRFAAADTWDEGQSIGDAVRPVVARFTGDGAAADLGVVLLWATVHGLIALAMAGRIAGGAEVTAQLIDRAVEDALVAWRGG